MMLGTRHTKETKDKMRAKAILNGNNPPSRIGIMPFIETRLKISKAHKNKPRNGNPSSWKHSEETKRKMSLSRGGDKMWNWKGGVTSINDKIRKSLDYRLWREEVFKRDDFTCQECKQRGGDMHADHIKQFAYFPELRFDISNGRTLCVECHRKTDTYGFNSLKLKLA